MSTGGPGRWAGLLWGLALSLGGATLSAQQGPGGAEGVVANTKTKVYHRPTCPVLKRATAATKLAATTAAEAASRGYTPCGTCRPSQGGDAGQGAAKPTRGKAGAKRVTPKGGPGKKDDDALKFSRDIAPIFVANCANCHGGAQPKAQFNLTTFNKLMTGGKSGRVIVPGKPEESRLVELLQSGEMPRGANRNLSEGAVARVEAWVKAGAVLDAGRDPDAELASYAATPDDLRRAELARLSPQERDQKAQAVALERWKKASSKADPTMTSDKHFLLFSNLPPERARALLKSLESQRVTIGTILGPRAATLSGPEKISVYVFAELNAYVEFVRAVESREVEPGDDAHGRFDVETPYLAAVAPLAGGDEPKRAAKGKGGDDGSRASERSLAGLLAEQLGAAAAADAGKPPRWLALGLGAYLGSLVEPRNPYYRRLRAVTADQHQLGWPAKATAALGDEGEMQTLRALGFSLVEWLAASGRPLLVGFVREMLDGREKLDDTIKAGWGPMADRNQFIDAWGRFVVLRYGRGR